MRHTKYIRLYVLNTILITSAITKFKNIYIYIYTMISTNLEKPQIKL